MKRIDCYIAGRLLANFVLLFAVLYLFAATIDVILNLDEFMKLAEESLGEDAGWMPRLITAMGYAIGYHLPQLSQFYAWLYGAVLVGAMCFTLAQMSRHRELVALVASGLSLRRIAMPFVAVAVGLGVLQAINQEFILPQLATRLLRSHNTSNQNTIDAFPIRFTDDADGMLLQASGFDPATDKLIRPSFIERDGQGRATRRSWAQTADWDEAEGAWVLSEGHTVVIDQDGHGSSPPRDAQPVHTDLSPMKLTMRRHGQIASMLSLGQIRDMLQWPDAREAQALRRSAIARFAMLGVNVLILLIALPFFLDRLPGELLAKAVWCSMLVLPLYFAAAGVMLVPVGGMSVTVGVLLPILVLLPIALARLGMIRT